MEKNSKEILIWGSGKIGRGFIADIFGRGGYGLCFVDSDSGLVDSLKQRGRYTVHNFSGADEKETISISDFEVYHTGEREQVNRKFLSCNLAAVAVFPGAFEQTARDMAPGIEARAAGGVQEPLDIIICANVFHPAARFRELLESILSESGKQYLKDKVGLVETLVIRMAVDPTDEMKALDPLVVLTNGYPELTVDKTAFKGEVPPVRGVLPTGNMRSEEVRKMYTYNMVHAIYAYLGKHKGCEYVADCTADPDIQETVRGALEEVSQALQKEYGFGRDDMDEWNRRVLRNMANPILKDKGDRVGADPIRKLKRDDRLTGPAMLCRKHGILPWYLAKGIAYGFLFYNPQDEASAVIKDYVRIAGIREAVRKFCGLEREVELIHIVQWHYEKAVSGNGMKEDTGRVEFIKRAFALGFEKEAVFKGCAQCTLATFFELTGTAHEMVFQAASGFSGGMAICSDGACGGYSGGILMMGTYAGRRLENFDADKDAQYKSYETAQKLHDKFIETYGSVICGDIHKQIFGSSYCLRTKPVRDEFEAAGAHKDKCTTVVATACMWVAEILLDEGFVSVGDGI